MSIRLARVDDRVSEESDDGDGDEGGVEVPVGQSGGDLLIERLEEDGHVELGRTLLESWPVARSGRSVSECPNVGPAGRNTGRRNSGEELF